MSFAVGSLVKARGREWVVLPDPRNTDDLLLVRPLVGTDEEATGIYLPAEPEPVGPAGFPPPDPDSELGNHRSGALLRDAMRLALRSAAGPLRSLGQIAVEPRPYQLVPLLMALRLDPVRLLIADDVGIGKSIEASLIARELLDRGEIGSLSVLCPPHLAEQWQRTLMDQFQIDAALVLPGTVRRLERRAGLGQYESLFAHYRHTVVSLDYIKSERHRHLFLQDSPDLVIVDEAHTCAASDDRRGARHRRHELLQALAKDAERHLLLVTATPHSGKDSHFRSLLGLLDSDLATLDLDGEVNRRNRERLARHLVQRRRGDLTRYLDADTPFPTREAFENSYHLTPDYRQLFDEVLDYCRERVAHGDLAGHQQRVRWWAALALLRALSSSPAAAATSLRNRSAAADTDTIEEADAVGRDQIFDLDQKSPEGADVAPGGQVADEDADEPGALDDRRRLLDLADRIESLGGDFDPKLQHAIELVRDLVQKGFSPIVFCRFIPTVHYVAGHMAKQLPGVTVAPVTGESHPYAREREVEALGEAKKRVLVCTDCLSEGINLQHHFDAVLHYDLSWNPTRHEQRDGRVDRYAQPKDVVRTITYFGEDNPIDGIVLRVLLRKHEQIRRDLGISVPVPIDSREVLEAMFEGLVLREHHTAHPEQLDLDFIEEDREQVARRWDLEADREKRSRSLFAQNTINEKEVAAELDAARAVLGDASQAQAFLSEALPELGVSLDIGSDGTWAFDLSEAPRALREAVGVSQLVGATEADGGAPRLVRAHPLVRATADYVWHAALDPHIPGPARRCCVIRTREVATRTTLLLLRMRFHLGTRDRSGNPLPLLAEEVVITAFTGAPERATWLDEDAARALLDLEPSENTLPDLARRHLRGLLAGLPSLRDALIKRAHEHGERLRVAHRRVREATTRRRGGKVTVEPRLSDGDPPVDLIGAYVYLPVAGSS